MHALAPERSWSLRFRLLVVGVACLASTIAAKADDWNIYNPALGTLPDAQGWTRNLTGTPPDPTISSGVLHQGPTGVAERQYWTQTSPTHLDLTAGFAMQFTLKVISSPLTITGGGTEYRTGWNVQVADRFGRDMEVAIAANAIVLTVDGHNIIGPTTVTAPFNTTDAYHHYLLLAQGNLACFYADGALLATLPIGDSDVQTPYDEVGFGDTTAFASGEVLLTDLRYAGPSWPGYYADQGTLPDDQGWARSTTGNPPPPTVAGGLLVQGPTGTPNRQYWTQTPQSNIDFAAGFALEFLLKVLTSSVALSGDTNVYRAGWNVYVADMNGRDLEVAIGSNLIIMTTDGHNYVGPTTVTAAFNTTRDFHLYRLFAQGSAARLYVDGNLVLSLPIGAMNTQTPFNQIGFGDTTISATGWTQLAGLRYTSDLTGGAYAISTPALVAGRIGQTVLLAASLSRADTGAPVSGQTIWFVVGTTIAGSAVTNASGIAKLAYVIPEAGGPGSRQITAVCDPPSAADVSTAVGTLSVLKGNPCLSFYAAYGSLVGSAVLRARLTSGAVEVVGRTVVFSVDGKVVGSGVTNSSGIAGYVYPIPLSLGTGTHNVTAAFDGSADLSFNSASRTAAVLTVTKAPTVISFYASSGSAGGGATLKCILLCGGNRVAGKTIVFTVEGNPAGGAATNASGVAQVTWTIPKAFAAGPHNVTASFDGSADTTYASTARTAAVLTVK